MDSCRSFACVRVHLRQAGEYGGAAGGAAAHGGEGVVEHQAALGQRAKVGGADHRVVIHLRLKAGVIGWKRENNSMSSCAACRPRPYGAAKTIKPLRAEINIHEATVQKYCCWTVDPGLLIAAHWHNPSVQFPWSRSRACWFPLQDDVRKKKCPHHQRKLWLRLIFLRWTQRHFKWLSVFQFAVSWKCCLFLLMIIDTEDVHTIRSDHFLLFLPALLFTALTMLKVTLSPFFKQWQIRWIIYYYLLNDLFVIESWKHKSPRNVPQNASHPNRSWIAAVSRLLASTQSISRLSAGILLICTITLRNHR